MDTKAPISTPLSPIGIVGLDEHDLAILADLKNRLLTQDNLGTAEPIWEVRVESIEWGFESDTSEETAYMDDEFSIYPDLDALKEAFTDRFEEEPVGLSESDLLDRLGFREVHGRKVTKVHKSGFLTMAAAESYIKRNSHNLGGRAFTYAISCWNNREMAVTRKLLMNIKLN